MSKFRFTIKFLALAIVMFASVSIAQAQASRTWVSGVGDDANPCSRTAPCKTFAGAISKTANCGEIDALDPGGYGAVTITKSITIDGTGTFASILASLVTGITINATSTDVITIRGVSINGFCNGLRAMNILQAKTVNIEDCVMFRFAGPGILVNESSDLALNIRNTVIRDNTGAGLDMTTSSGSVKFSISNCSFNGNSHGVHAKSRTQGTADNSVFANNTTNGIFTDAVTAGTVAIVRVWNSQMSNNGGSGVRAGNAGNAGTAVVQIGQSQLNNNTTAGALLTAPGILETFQNNSMEGNGNNTCGGGGGACTPKAPGQ
jgi:hypothetical protein